MTPDPRRSGLLEDLLGPDTLDAVDGTGADEIPVGLDGVDRRATAAVVSGLGDGTPGDLETIAVEPTDTLLDRTGDDPLHGVDIPVVGGLDDHGAGVLDADRVGAVHRVGADDPLTVDDLAARHGASSQSDESDQDAEAAERHAADGSERRGLPRWTKVLGIVLGVLIGAALAFAIIQPIKVLPRIRVAPGYALTDQHDQGFSSETVRGSVTLYSFQPLDCGETCEPIDETLRRVRARVATDIDFGDVDFRIVTIALADAPSSTALAAEAAAAGADGETWRWVGGPIDTVRTVVGAGFRRYVEVGPDGSIDFDHGFAIVDGNGVLRAEHRYETSTEVADDLIRQLDLLADELGQSGIAGLAYDAAHLFLCYD